MGQYLLEQDALRGAAGGAWIEVDGQNEQLFQLKNLNVSADFNITTFKVVGALQAQSKTSGVDLSGTFTLYQGNPTLLRMLYSYITAGRTVYFTMQVKAADPSSTIGKSTISLYNCQLTNLDMISLDADADVLTQDASFTFTHFEIIDEYSNPTQLGFNRVEEW